MWHVINKETGSSLQCDHKIGLINGKEIISNPQETGRHVKVFSLLKA
jgi:hypothetical protein